MSGELPKKVDVRRQMIRETVLEGDIPVTACARLSELTVRDSGVISATFTFGRSDTRKPRLTGQLSGALWLPCQRCMQPVEVPVEQALDLLVMPSEAAADRLEREQEFCISQDGEVDLWTIAEDETLLALPIVARHTHDCATLPATETLVEEAGSARKSPFADLADMLKNSKPDN